MQMLDIPDTGYAGTFAKVSYTKRKDWNYTDIIEKMKLDIKKEQEAQQKENPNNYKITKILKVEIY